MLHELGFELLNARGDQVELKLGLLLCLVRVRREGEHHPLTRLFVWRIAIPELGHMHGEGIILSSAICMGSVLMEVRPYESSASRKPELDLPPCQSCLSSAMEEEEESLSSFPSYCGC
ncbi:hypothetical protein Dimus_028437 [Dionaea muscipula]